MKLRTAIAGAAIGVMGLIGYQAAFMMPGCYNLLDEMQGDPTPGGCWYQISVPAGSTIMIDDQDGDNPQVCLNGQPLGDYIFEYSPVCCTDCLKATLTICNVSDDDCTDPLIISATESCN